VLERYSNLGTTANRIRKVRASALRLGPRVEPEADWEPQALVRRLGEEQMARLVEDYAMGDGCTTLSRRYGVSENAVLAHLKRVGVPIRPFGKVTLDDVADMYRLRASGWTYRAIGIRFGITRTGVSSRLRRLGGSPMDDK
jgi:hypothetical protein